MEISACTTQKDFSEALTLVRDYIQWLDMDLSFQDIHRELAGFSRMYSPPAGLFLLARSQGRSAGGVGFRTLSPRVCEMKRLFVYDAFRGQGVGRHLCNSLIQAARSAGFERMRLDTLERMTHALKLYQALGFTPIAPYCFNPDPTAQYLELCLA